MSPALVCHRGLWHEPREKNTLAAFQAAVSHGYGVELDVRMRRGQVVVAHHPAETPKAPTLGEALDAMAEQATRDGWTPRLIVDVKEAAAQIPTARVLRSTPWSDGREPPHLVLRSDAPAVPGLPEALTPKVAFTEARSWPDREAFRQPEGHRIAYGDAFFSGPTDWRSQACVETLVAEGFYPILTSDEVYGRRPRIREQASNWQSAYAIVTDLPDAYRRVFEAGHRRGPDGPTAPHRRV